MVIKRFIVFPIQCRQVAMYFVSFFWRGESTSRRQTFHRDSNSVLSSGKILKFHI